MQVFLSHSSADRTLADALKQLLSDYFDGRVTVVFSSDDDSGGGIAPGANGCGSRCALCVMAG